MRVAKWLGAGVAMLLILGVLVWQAVTGSGNPDPLTAQTSSSAAILDIGILVFREGLECILVLAAITAGLSRTRQGYGSSIASGAGIGIVATLVTWSLAVAVMDDLSQHISDRPSRQRPAYLRAADPGWDRPAGDRGAADRDELVLP
jgi:high-affinity iron transporter